jgi:hypothetical protein
MEELPWELNTLMEKIGEIDRYIETSSIEQT